MFQASKDVIINMEGSVESDNLKLQDVQEITKVLQQGNQRFKQPLTYDGKRLLLTTGAIPSSEIKLSANDYGKCALIPVSPWLRQQLDTIEDYVIGNIAIPPCLLPWSARDQNDSPYKKIWEGKSLYLPLSNWAKFLRQDADHLTDIQPGELGDGTYEMCISIEGVYFGYHKDNKLASITMRIQQILFNPLVSNIDAIIDDILRDEGGVKNAKRRRKKKDD